MTVSFVGAGQAGGTFVSVPVPAGTGVGDKMIASVLGTTSGISGPTGWTALTVLTNAGAYYFQAFYRDSPGGEPAGYYFSSGYIIAVIATYRGAVAGLPPVHSTTGATTTLSDIITVVDGTSLIVNLGMAGYAPTNFANDTLRFPDANSCVADRPAGAPGVNSSGAATLPSAGGWSALSVELVPTVVPWTPSPVAMLV